MFLKMCMSFVIMCWARFFYLRRLKIFVPITFLAWAILVPVNYTNDALEAAKMVANVTASDIDKLSISNIPLKSQR